MKLIFAPVAAVLALSAPTFADTSPAELFAMSNNSAAETIIRETSMGDITAARIKLALNNMNAAERQAFFSANNIDRIKIIENQRFFGDGDSAAEMAVEIDAIRDAQN